MIETLVKKIKETQAPIVVGLDPNLNFVPEFIKENCFKRSKNFNESHKRCLVLGFLCSVPTFCNECF